MNRSESYEVASVAEMAIAGGSVLPGTKGGTGGLTGCRPTVRLPVGPPPACLLDQIRAQEGKTEPSNGSDCLPPWTLQVADGGRLIVLHHHGGEGSKPGKRQEIAEFSKRSAHNLQCALNRIDRRQVLDGHVIFAALTYPHAFPTARESKVHLRQFVWRHNRRWGKKVIFWKLEPQRRGAPHYHLLVIMGPGVDEVAYRAWFAQAWFEIAGGGDLRHLRVHQHPKQCQVMRSWNGVSAYAAKYLAKPCDAHGAGWEKPGRFWGIENRALLPELVLDEGMNEHEGRCLRRLLRRWYRSQVYGGPLIILPQKVHGSRKLPVFYAQALDESVQQEYERARLAQAHGFAARHGGYIGHRRRRAGRGFGGVTCFMSDETLWRLLKFVRADIAEKARVRHE